MRAITSFRTEIGEGLPGTKNQLVSRDRGETFFNRLLVVSNRLPITVNNNSYGELQVKPSSGGLVTALSPVLRNNTGLWTGWPGSTTDIHLNGHLDRAGEQLGCNFEPVMLSEKEFNDYYIGFSNQVLWPLFHDFPEYCRSNSGFWNTYQKVNRKFARTLARISNADDYIWVQDYHLILLARELRNIGLKRQIGFFLHTPFPPPDILKILPWRIQLIEAMLDYDLVGFQTQRDKDNFIKCTEEISGLDYWDEDKLTTLSNANRSTRVGVFPISIDVSEFERLALSGEVEERVEQLRKTVSGRQIILGVDRLDYSKGIPLRLKAYRTFLERFKSVHGRVAMTQVVVPSRDSIPEYQAVKKDIENMVTEINDRFGDDGWTPIRYICESLDRSELVAYYRAADIALVTPVRDGMNLVSKEYCASNVDNEGILILSEFAGAANQLHRDALIVNPYNTDMMADMIYQAYQMPADERRMRMQRLRQSISGQDIHWWSKLFLRSAGQAILDNIIG